MGTEDKAKKIGPVTRIVLVIGGAAAYFALAILGWGGLTAFFSHPALVVLTMATAALVIVDASPAETSVREFARTEATVGFSGYFR